MNKILTIVLVALALAFCLTSIVGDGTRPYFDLVSIMLWLQTAVFAGYVARCETESK